MDVCEGFLSLFLSPEPRRHILCQVTYADNYAIGYFKKQGFHMQVGQPTPLP
jgi:hypothetical protein